MNTKYGLMMTMAVMLVALSVVSGWADRTISLDLHNVTIGEALAQLFTKADVDYAVKDGVSGTIADLSVVDVPFGIALKDILGRCNLEYEVVNGVYNIKPKLVPDPPPQATTAPSANTETPHPHATPEPVTREPLPTPAVTQVNLGVQRPSPPIARPAALRSYTNTNPYASTIGYRPMRRGTRGHGRLRSPYYRSRRNNSAYRAHSLFHRASKSKIYRTYKTRALSVYTYRGK